MTMNTDWMDHIDWTNELTYQELSAYLSALADSFESANVSSGTGNTVDGYVKRGIVERLREFALVFKHPSEWLIVRPERNYSPHQGHKKN